MKKLTNLYKPYMLLSIKKKLMLILAVLTCFNMSITAATIEPLWECEAHGVSDVVRSSIGFGDKIYVSNVITGCVEEWHKGNKTKEWNVNQFLSSQNENTTLWTAITCDDFGNILVNIGGKEDVAGGTKWLLIPADGSQMQIVEINYPSKVTPGRIDYIGRVIGNLLDDAYAVFAPSENPDNIFDLFGPNQSNNVVLINLRKGANGQVVSDLNKSRIIPSKTACSIGINVVMNTTYREISSLSSVKDVGSKIYLRNYKNSNLFMWNGNHLTEQKGIGNDGCTARGFDVFTIKDVDYYVVPCNSSDGRTASFEVRYLNTGDVAAQYSTNGTKDSEYSSYTARVSSDGKSAVIYAFNDKDKIGVYTFKPDGYVELIQDLSIDSDTTLKVGETAALKAMITPETATNKTLVWTSMSESIATVDNNGMISAIAPGNTKIIATTTDGTELSDTCAVTVIQLVQDLKIDTDTTLNVGETAVLKATITPETATNKTLEWTSMNESIATVDNNGMISAIAPGNTKIIATTTDGTELSDTCAVTVIQLVQDLKIDTDTTLKVGETAVLKVTITPETATNKTLIWASNNIAVATVINGTVTALSAGTATITATTTDGTGLSAACTVTVKYPTVYVQSISIEEEKTLNVGETTTITATISPSNASNKSLNWTSLNTDVATVSNGVVTAKSAGTATITATTTDGTILSDTCVITVVQLVETLTIDRKKTLSVGETASITAIISPSNATNKSLNWTSLNTDVATVSNGVVTAKSIGTATITATTTDGTILSDTCVVTVVQLVETLTIDSEKTLNIGETATITATILPDKASNKSLNWHSLNRDIATVSNGVVTAKSAGTATITATTTDGTNLSDTCVVTVNQPIIEQLWVHDMSSVGSAVRRIACVSDSEVAATNISFSGGSDNVIFFNASGQTSKVHDVAKFLNDNKIGTTNDSIGFSPYSLGCGIDVDGVGNIVVNLGFPSATSATNFVAIAPDGTMKHIVCEDLQGEAARADFLGVTGDIFTNGYIGLTPSGMNYAFVYSIYEGEQDKDYSYLVNSDEVTFSSDTKLFFPNKETKLYLTPNDNWKMANARFAAYFFGSDGYSWASMTAVEGETDIYEVTIPTGSWTNVIFCRMNPDTSENNWDNRWNQTADLFYGGVNNHFIVPNGSWDGANTGWTINAPEFYVYQRSLKGLRYSDGTSALTIMEGDNFSQGKAANSGATAFVVNGITYIVMPTPDESGARANAFKIVNVATGEVALTCQGAEGFATYFAQDFSSYVNEDGTVSIAQLVQGQYLAMYVFDPSGNYEPEPEPTVVVESLTIDSEKVLNVGETATITATILPDNATNKELSWSSTNINVATVENGEITGVAAGTAKIIATTTDGTNLSDTCTVTIEGNLVKIGVVDKLVDKTIRRTIVNNNNLYILAIDSLNNPTILVVDIKGNTIIAEVSTEGCEGTHLNLSDIQLTSDGYLVGCSKEWNQFADDYVYSSNGEDYKQYGYGDVRGECWVYKWENDSNGLPSGDPIKWVSTTSTGNWYRAIVGETFAYSGTIVNGMIVLSAQSATATGIRAEVIEISDNEKVSNSYSQPYLDGEYATIEETSIGETYNYVTSPLAANRYMVVSAGDAPIYELEFAHADRTNQIDKTSNDIVPANTPNADFIKYAGKSVMVIPAINEENKVAGIKIFDITDSLKNTTEIILDKAIIAPTDFTYASAHGILSDNSEDINQNIELFLVVNEKIYKHTTTVVDVFGEIEEVEESDTIYKSITLEKEKILEIGESVDIAVTLSPDSISNKTLQWTSSDESIATISNGTVTAHSLGTVKITAKTTNNLSDVCIVTVVKATELFSIENNRVIGVGETADIKVKKMPETNDSISWESSDESIATVYNGIVSAVSEGTVKIIATTTDGSNLSDTCIVTVVQETISLDEVRIYINPGHGSWGPNNRHMATVAHNPISMENPDTTDFFESNTNLQKAFGVLEKLIDYGVPFDKTKNQTNNNPNRIGAALDLTQNLVMSHVKCGPYPYETVDGVNPDQHNDFNRILSVIAAEVEANDFDMFISIHSNAATDGSTVNYLYFAYDNIYTNSSGSTTDELGNEHIALSKEMSRCGWNHRILDRHTQWSHYDYTMTKEDLAAGKGKIGWQNLGVLNHSVPGYLVEGYFHTYQPARHRAMNWDVCRQEGVAYARGIADYFGWEKESTGDIYGVVRDLYEEFTHEYYNAREVTNDVYLPLNNVQVTLVKEDVVIDTYSTDDEYNGAFVFTDLEPGTYTLEFYHEDYNSVVPVTVTVSEAETSYPSVFLEKVDSANSSETVTNASEKGKGSTAVEAIEINDSEEVIEYYNLQGIRVENPEKGIYIKKQGSKATKVILK